MIRSFRPVGQGNFAVEKFDNCNFVFDCGSSSKKTINREIDLVFNKSEIIEAVYLSHLDFDHVSGIDHLIQRCNVNEIVIPYLNNHDRFFSLFRLLYDKYAFSSQFMNWIIKNEDAPEYYYNNKRIKITRVRPLNQETINDADNLIRNDRIIGKIDWIISPFNYQINNTSIFTKAVISNNLTMHLTVSNLSTSWKTVRKTLRSIYKSLPGGINMNSMVVYSGRTKQSLKCYNKLEASLYTGDYDTLSVSYRNALLVFVKDYIPGILNVTVPHHGSRNNYHSAFSYPFDSEFIIQFNPNYKRYNHPSKSVLKQLNNQNKKIILIDQNSLAHNVLV